MKRSIFQDVPDEIDESWTAGFLIGGMAVSNIQTIALSYKVAGDLLLQAALSSGTAYEFSYPILFNYRHCIELYLKTILQPQKTNHDLKKLLEDLENYCLQNYSQKLPTWFKTVVLEFDEFDSRSTSFRYEQVISSKSSGISNELWIDLHILQKVMDRLHKAFQWLIKNKINS
jgi:hypothetical protein